MDAFVNPSKRRRDDSPLPDDGQQNKEDDSTDVKLALLASLHPNDDSEALFEALIAADGSVEAASDLLNGSSLFCSPGRQKKQRRVAERSLGHQTSLARFALTSPTKASKQMTRKGQTLHLYSPEDVAAHTPCSIRHSFLSPSLADALLRELLAETPTYSRDTFKIFDNVVTSPHTFCFYVDGWDEAEQQKTEYIYNGGRVTDVRESLPVMQQVAAIVKAAVNEEIQERIKTRYPGGKKLRYQTPEPWSPNTSFVNCYDGGKESVGFHSDQLTYLGPRAVIGSISLGVAREFRVRRVVPRNTTFEPTDTAAKKANDDRADVEGQIAIHLPHNSLLVMHAEMQEEWKHAIAPAQAIDPHPIAGGKRLNVTYRCYRKSLHPKYTPRCKCNVATVLRCVQKQEANRGRYMWMCHAGLTPDSNATGCGFFQWADFDDDGEPPWAWKLKGGARDKEDTAST